jgi:hypothetical protein
MISRLCKATGEALLIPVRKPLEQGRFYNRLTGKWIEDERVADGCVVAKKQGNACGAKAPY